MSDSVEQQLVQLVASVADTPESQVRGADNLDALGLDSLAVFEILGKIEERFGVELEIEDAFELETFDDVVGLVRSRVSA